MSNKLITTMEGMEVREDVIDEGEVTEEEGDDAEAEGGRLGVGGGLFALEATGILSQDAEPGGITLTDACNGFNELIILDRL